MITNNRDIINDVSKRLGVSSKVVDEVYKQYFEFINRKISGLKLFGRFDEGEFERLKTKFPIKHIGSLYISKERVISINKRKLWKRSNVV